MTLILSHSSQNGYQEENKQQILVRMQGREKEMLSYTLLVGM
jgi:hypothetical protein